MCSIFSALWSWWSRRGENNGRIWLWLIFFFGGSNEKALHRRNFFISIQLWHVQSLHVSRSLTSLGLKWMADLWIRADRYLLSACQHGNTSSVGSTGTGSCGAGQSDTPCLIWENKNKVFMAIGKVLLSCSNLNSERATKQSVDHMQATDRRCDLFRPQQLSFKKNKSKHSLVVCNQL